MNNNQAIQDYLREIINKEIIMKYLFIKSMEEDYGDEYLTRKYRINVSLIRKSYDKLKPDERDRIQRDIETKIVNGEIDLSREAVRWHKEELNKYYKKDINKINSNKNSNKEKRGER